MGEKQPLRYRYSKYEGITYIIDEEETVAGIFGLYEHNQHFFIPRSIKHETKEYNVTIIMNEAFNYSSIQSIQLASDSQLQTIDNNAFSHSAIKSIRIPSSVTFIGESAFSDCKQLESIEIPNDSKLKTIDNNAFYNSKIERITIP